MGHLQSVCRALTCLPVCSDWHKHTALHTAAFCTAVVLSIHPSLREALRKQNCMAQRYPGLAAHSWQVLASLQDWHEAVDLYREECAEACAVSSRRSLPSIKNRERLHPAAQLRLGCGSTHRGLPRHLEACHTVCNKHFGLCNAVPREFFQHRSYSSTAQ